MITIGLLGGVASGKSLVAEMLGELGAVVLNADAAGHRVLGQPEVKAALKARWGDDVFDPDGSADRAAIAARVFAETSTGAEDRKFLEQLLHPRIGQQLQEQIARREPTGANVVVLDAPLLLEAGWDGMCDALLFVEVPRHLRLGRALQRGWSEAQFDRREAAQLDVAEKRQRADAVVTNAGTVAELRRQVEQYWSQLRR